MALMDDPNIPEAGSGEPPRKDWKKFTCVLPPDVWAIVENMAKDRNMPSLNAAMIELIQFASEQAPEWVLRERTIDDAAEALVSILPKKMEELIREIAKDRHRPVASFVMSYIHSAVEQGRAAMLLSEYEDPLMLTPERMVRAQLGKEAICKHCTMPFQTERLGQTYCSYECGMAVAARKVPA